MKLPKIIVKFLFIVLLLVSSFPLTRVSASDVSPTPTPSPTSQPSDNSQNISGLQQKINDLQNKITDLKGQEKSLSSEIDTMDSKIAITQYRINLTQKQITDVEMDIDTARRKIITLEGSLNGLTKILLSRIVATYEVGSAQQPLSVLASSTDVTDFFTRANYLKIAQAHDKQLVYDTVQARNDYANQKNILEAQKKRIEDLQHQLQDYTKELDLEKTSKQTLLAQTQGSEANYQKILAQTKAELESFSSFTANNGGSSILSSQTVCDDWGCYYNQRDSAWGGTALNGTQYSIASDGCLMTSMAMVYTHYGNKNVTPLSINSVPGNFDGIPPALLKYSITANGISSQRISVTIDSTLNDSNHDPVIVGIHAYGGTHFIVLVSGSQGSYIMNDPYLPAASGGHNGSFNAHYSINSIFEVDKVVL